MISPNDVILAFEELFTVESLEIFNVEVAAPFFKDVTIEVKENEFGL